MNSRQRIGIEVPLKAGKPMIMSDDDLVHFNAMFNACKEKFSTVKHACNIITEALSMTDLHIDLFAPKTYSTHVKPYAGFSYYLEYQVYNARTGYGYDVILRLGKHPDGTCSVELCIPDKKVRE